MADSVTTGYRVILVPPWENASEEHWMSTWERKYSNALRVEQDDWMNPVCAEWVRGLDRTVREVDSAPIILVSHSLGGLTVAHWASEFRHEIAAAFLVAPPDVERSDTPNEIRNFGPIPLAEFPFPSLVVASGNDPYATLERSRYFAAAWGSHLVDVGAAGHINVKSGHGEWVQGEELFERFIEEVG